MSKGLPHPTEAGPGSEAPRRVAFAALQHRDFRYLFITAMLCMMGDFAEHVISYWVLFETFDSHFLAGFAVVSHWLPFLLFSVFFGWLADRYDCRRVIQISQLLFLIASLAWGVLFLTDSLQMWHAVLILIVHGMAGALFGPASQLILHDMVGDLQLASAVRLTATSRQLGFLFGPALGGALLLFFGPAVGILLNALCYVPMILWVQTVPYTGHPREGAAKLEGGFLASILSPWRVLREVSDNPVIVAMVAVVGVGALLVGNAYQAEMPAYATDLGSHEHDFAYSALFAAHAAGAVVGGALLETSKRALPRPQTAILFAALFSITMTGFALARSIPVAFAMLFFSGIFFLAFSSTAQAIVQLLAPPAIRGRVIGMFNTAQQGLRIGSGFTVSGLGAWIGIHASLAFSALAFLASAALLLLVYLRRAKLQETGDLPSSL